MKWTPQPNAERGVPWQERSALGRSTSEKVEMSRETLRIVIVACLVSDAPVLARSKAEAPRSPTPKPVKAAVRVETVARGLDHP